jgi:hypothetical protein
MGGVAALTCPGVSLTLPLAKGSIRGSAKTASSPNCTGRAGDVAIDQDMQGVEEEPNAGQGGGPPLSDHGPPMSNITPMEDIDSSGSISSSHPGSTLAHAARRTTWT